MRFYALKRLDVETGRFRWAVCIEEEVALWFDAEAVAKAQADMWNEALPAEVMARADSHESGLAYGGGEG